MRKFVRCVAALVLVGALVAPARAGTYPNCEWSQEDPGTCVDEGKDDISSRTRIYVNGAECRVAKVTLYRNRTYVPLRAFSECMNMTVTWLPDGYNSVVDITGAPQTLGQSFDAYFQPIAQNSTVRVVYSDNSEQRFLLDGEPYLDESLNLTMVPFRFVTDLINAKTTWRSADEGNPFNEIRVDLRTISKPVDAWQDAQQYVGYTNERGFYLLDGGRSGYNIYPSTLRNVSYSLELYSAILKEKGQNGAEIDFNNFRVRTSWQFGLIDFYGPVTVRWFTDDEAAQQYTNHLNRQQHYVKSGVGISGGAVTLVFGATAGIWGAVGSLTTLGVSTWQFFAEDWTADMQACTQRAGLSKYANLRRADAPAIWGIANTPNGEFCVPFYTEDPLHNMTAP